MALPAAAFIALTLLGVVRSGLLDQGPLASDVWSGRQPLALVLIFSQLNLVLSPDEPEHEHNKLLECAATSREARQEGDSRHVENPRGLGGMAPRSVIRGDAPTARGVGEHALRALLERRGARCPKSLTPPAPTSKTPSEPRANGKTKVLRRRSA
jgi:hypothetical protein